jgi:predicted TIM-barrel enzyme
MTKVDRRTDPAARKRLLDRLFDARATDRAILGAGTGTGLVAKAAAAANPDFIVVYCTSKARNRGFPTSIIGDPNGITLELLPDVIRVAGDVPVVAGIQATDPTRDMGDLLATYADLGCAGVINYPSSGLYGPGYIGGPYSYMDGLRIEGKVLAEAQAQGLASMTYIYRPEEAAILVPSVDVAVAHAGWTTGGMDGAPEGTSYELAARVVDEQIQAIQKASPDVVILAHGGPFSGPADVEKLYQLTEAEGFIGASSIERIPVERAVFETVEDFMKVNYVRKVKRS